LKSSDILVIGDSHAHRHLYAINYAIQDNFRFKTLNLFGETSCSFLHNFDNDARCDNGRKRTSELMKTMHPDYLFIVAHMENNIPAFVERMRTLKVGIIFALFYYFLYCFRILMSKQQKNFVCYIKTLSIYSKDIRNKKSCSFIRHRFTNLVYLQLYREQ